MFAQRKLRRRLGLHLVAATAFVTVGRVLSVASSSSAAAGAICASSSGGTGGSGGALAIDENVTSQTEPG